MKSLAVMSTRLSYQKWCSTAYTNTVSFAEENTNTIMFFVGVALLYGGLNEFVYAYGYGSFEAACGGVISFVEGAFGALVAACAGIGAIIAAAVGGFKAAWSLLIVSIAAFILRSFITLFSGMCGSNYGFRGITSI